MGRLHARAEQARASKEVRARLGMQKGGSRADEAAAAASRARDGMQESIEALHERGAKLSDLGDKTSQLAQDADDFAAMARELRKQQERPFFGLF